jgi:hypothetical protein
MSRKPPVMSRQSALIVGYGGILLGAWSLWQAYEARGVKRPFLTKFLPGA